MDTTTTTVETDSNHPIQMTIKAAAAIVLLSVGVLTVGRWSKSKLAARKARKTQEEK